MEGIFDVPKVVTSNEVVNKDDESEDFLETLPQCKSAVGYSLVQYKGFWFNASLLHATLRFQKHFQADDSDIILATMPKSGTTWLKALIFSIVNRKNHEICESPLLSSNPHRLVPFLEINLYQEREVPDINSFPSPRIFATHIPYQCLPNTVLDGSGCRIVYLCRNPLDMFNSMFHFLSQNGLLPPEPLSKTRDGAFEPFLEGTYTYGPFWDHVLGYWEASLKDPKKVLFLKYEDLKKDINSSVKKMAEFLGCAFSAEEENEGLVGEITKLCSLENLKNLECNNKGETQGPVKAKHSSYFRRGEVGDWVNFLSPSLSERLQKEMIEKFGSLGLTLDIHT